MPASEMLEPMGPREPFRLKLVHPTQTRAGLCVIAGGGPGAVVSAHVRGLVRPAAQCSDRCGTSGACCYGSPHSAKWFPVTMHNYAGSSNGSFLAHRVSGRPAAAGCDR